RPVGPRGKPRAKRLRLRLRRAVLPERAARQQPAIELAERGVRTAVVRQDAQLDPLRIVAGVEDEALQVGVLLEREAADRLVRGVRRLDRDEPLPLARPGLGRLGRLLLEGDLLDPAALAGLHDDLGRQTVLGGAVAAVAVADVLVDQSLGLVAGLLAGRREDAGTEHGRGDVRALGGLERPGPGGPEAREIPGADRARGQGPGRG